MKKAFSLIEILQTVILIGIIAGISVSFFKNLNTDEKLYNSTNKMLEAAIKEAELRLLSDARPVCGTGGTFISNICTIPPGTPNEQQRTYCIDNDLQCQNVNTFIAAAGLVSAYNWESGYCEYKPAANAACATGFTKKGEICYAAPSCTSYDATNPVDISPAFPYFDKINRLVDDDNDIYEAGVLYEGGIFISEFCRHLHSIINHKSQEGVGGRTDLVNTCATSVDACVIADTCASTTNPNNHANMILPNGVRLYNLNCYTPNGPATGCANGNIYIKYDRNSDLRTMNANNTKPYAPTAGVSP